MKQNNEQIFSEIRELGFITERHIRLLKMRSQKERRDLWEWSLDEEFEDYGVPVESAMGERGLEYLRKWAKRRNSPFGNREKTIIANATANDFRFLYFRNFGDQQFPNFQPVYSLSDGQMSMEYTPLGEPYVQG